MVEKLCVRVGNSASLFNKSMKYLKKQTKNISYIQWMQQIH